MDKRIMDYLTRRRDREDGRRGVRGSGRGRRGRDTIRRDHEDGRRRPDRRDYEDNRRRRDRRDYEDDYEYDYEDGYDYDYEDGYDYDDGADYHGRSELRLTKQDLREWKQMLENADGTEGPHYDMQQIMSVANKMGIKFDEFTEAEFCMTVNMIYSDYCRTVKKYVAPEKMLEYCADIALDFLCDKDGPGAGTKLMLYYHCIVNA